MKKITRPSETKKNQYLRPSIRKHPPTHENRIYTFVIWKVFRHRRVLDLLGKNVHFVQKQNHRRVGEPWRVANGIEQHERFLHLILHGRKVNDGLKIWYDTYVVGESQRSWVLPRPPPTESLSSTKQESYPLMATTKISAVTFSKQCILCGPGVSLAWQQNGWCWGENLPFLTFTSLATNVKHAIGQGTKVKDGLHDACCLDATSYNIAVSWYIVYGKESIQIMIKAEGGASRSDQVCGESWINGHIHTRWHYRSVQRCCPFYTIAEHPSRSTSLSWVEGKRPGKVGPF